MARIFYVVPTATSSHAEDTPVVRNDRRACLRSIARKRSGSRIRSRTLTQVASRVAALKTLEGALLSLMLSQRIAARSFSNTSALLAAPELAKLFGVPESWVREQARLGNLPSIKLGHYVRFRIEEVERFLAQRASQAA